MTYSTQELLRGFQSIQLTLHLQNLTSGLPIAQATMLEMEDKRWVLSVSKRSCASGHQLSLRVEVQDGKQTLLLDLTASVQAIDPGETEDQATLNLVQFNQRVLYDFYDLYQHRQQQIMSMLLSLKGEEE